MSQTSDDEKPHKVTLQEVADTLNKLTRTVTSLATKLDHTDTVVTAITQTIGGIETNEVEDETEEPKRPPLFNIQNRCQNPLHRHNPRTEPKRAQTSLAKPKITVPPFQGRYDPDAYCDWENQVDLLFEYYQCPEEDQVPLLTLEFTEYASIWWSQLVRNRRLNGEAKITSWGELKEVLRERFVPPLYRRELKQKLQKIRQGYRTVDEYLKEMESLMQRADIQEDEEDTLTRFIVELNDNILEVLELKTYDALEEAFQFAMTIEKRIKDRQRYRQKSYPYDRGTTQPLSNSNTSNPLADSSRAKQKPEASKPLEKTKAKIPMTTENTQTAKKIRDIVCFKYKGHGHYQRDCPNTRLFLVREDGTCTSDSELSDNEFIADNYSSDELDPRSLVIQRVPLQKEKMGHACIIPPLYLCLFIF
ncbi:hypothetical protein HRI_004750900 [Hibiscus trionum]|uniref:Retrotransposon gag domain-containing protein n=1 Tax=Hibiscus trionum TaxID=183268 RepID=A0A9W7JCV8_HIBTR|nr:hypothetical protein HRI_004750900 [Hibiscus trionum]